MSTENTAPSADPAPTLPADSVTYRQRRQILEHYFDKTASETWARLTSDSPVSGVRARVRAGRDEMRAQILDWLGADLSGRRVLDAGCGTGALAIEAARRGADVVAIDIAGSLVSVAAERTPEDIAARIDYRVGDMTDPALGSFDHVVAMDSLIHYRPEDIANAVKQLSSLATRSVAFTFAPNTPLLSLLYGVGKLFPRSDRSPAIVPIGEQRMRRELVTAFGNAAAGEGRTQRVSASFYISQLLEVTAAAQESG